MDTQFIVIIVLLVFIVLLFLSIAIAIAVGVAKVANVTRPITNTIRTIRKVTQKIPRFQRRASKTKQQNQEMKTIVEKARTAAKQVRVAIQNDLRHLATQLKERVTKSKLPKKLPNLAHLIMVGFEDLCSQMTKLWTDHVNLTYYYGTLALQKTIACADQEKMDATANDLLNIQREIGDQLCIGNDDKRTKLIPLLQEHITLVAQMADQWRKNPSGGFDANLMQKWYDNANQTIQLLGGGEQLATAYKQHLDETAAYLSSLAKGDQATAITQLDHALEHAAGDLAKAFCEVKC